MHTVPLCLSLPCIWTKNWKFSYAVKMLENVIFLGPWTSGWILILLTFPSFIFIRLCWLPECSVNGVAHICMCMIYDHSRSTAAQPVGRKHCRAEMSARRRSGSALGKATCLLSKGRHVRWTLRVTGGDNQLRQERKQELEGVLPSGRWSFVGVSEGTAGRWRQTKRRTARYDLFLSF